MGKVIKFREPNPSTFTEEELRSLQDWSYLVFKSFGIAGVHCTNGVTDEGEGWLVFTHEETGAVLHSVFIENGRVYLSSEFIEEDLSFHDVPSLMKEHAPQHICEKWGYFNVV